MPPKNPPKKTKPHANAKKPTNGEGDKKQTADSRQPPKKKDQSQGRGRGKKEGRPAKNDNGQQQRNNNKNQRSNNNPSEPYPPYWPLPDCLRRYAAKDTEIVRGKLRVLPSKDGASFVTCDRGVYKADVCVPGPTERNRAMDGDMVYLELFPEEEKRAPTATAATATTLSDQVEALNLDNEQTNENDEAGDTIVFSGEDDVAANKETWQDDAVQMNLWNPIVSVPRRQNRKTAADTDNPVVVPPPQQRKGRVVYILPPKSVASEIPSNNKNAKKAKPATRRLVGSLKILGSGTCLLTPNNKSLPQFKCPPNTSTRFNNKDDDRDQAMFSAEYEYGSWGDTHKWPPCQKVEKTGKAGVVEDEIQALLTENEVDHGDFEADVLQDVEKAVESGVFLSDKNSKELDWKPTPEMCVGRRDYRKERIFTIDPTTAKDLDDALHVKELPDGRVEIGVHIADVSFFIEPETAVDKEAAKRATTVYLVDRTVPMLPRPLCEVACSLNENVERLAFSCVWTMNKDGTLKRKGGKDEDVWYGRTVIKSCARLDYSTAQNIIDKKVAFGESESELDETLWPKSRRPTGGHTIDDVAADVRLMHVVAMARRKLRFDNGALALHGIKLTFQLDSDGQTPLMAVPYPIRDSNKLIEEYMLMANYLVAQRLISHANGRALLRQHPEPLDDGLNKVVEVAKASINFDIDASSSATLHASLHRLSNECDDPLVLQSVTQLLMTPMQPAEYFAAGQVESELWRHFALNIPYYTHFTSPIRRYPDVIVHRLLQATLDGDEAVEEFPWDPERIHQVSSHCNEMRMKSKTAQERCDRVFLSLFVRNKPMESELGVVLSVGVSTFNVYVPSLGVSTMLFLEEHKEVLTAEPVEEEDGSRCIVLKQKPGADGMRWGMLDIKVFTKLKVTVYCREKPPIDVKLKLEGPWTE